MEQKAAAFQELLGLKSLPETGKQAREASRSLSDLVLAATVVPPQLAQLVVEHLTATPPVRPRFIDVSTGLRLRYLEWGSGGDVVLLLHDLGEAADIWAPIAPSLADRGYHIFALDLRGHGESGRSLDGRYSVDMLAEDIKAFIVAKDLYVAPLAVVGCGMGAVAGLALAQQNPILAGALLVAEFALPVAAMQARQAQQAQQAQGATESDGSSGSGQTGGDGGCGSSGASASCSSKQLLPWWGFRAGQAAAFASIEHCVAFLAHPLANLSPPLFLPLARAAQRVLTVTEGQPDQTFDADGSGNGSSNESDSSTAITTATGSSQSGAGPNEEEAAKLQQLLVQAQRPIRGVVASACSMLRAPQRMMQGGGGMIDSWGGYGDGRPASLQPRIDPSFLFSFDPAALLAGLPSLRCNLLLLHGGSSGSWVEPADAAAMARLAAAGDAASAGVAEIPGAGHWLAADCPEPLLKQIVAFLEGPAICCFDRRSLLAPRNSKSSSSSSSAGASSTGAGPNQDGGSGCAEEVGEAQVVDSRRPELLNLKPLPQYASLEEGKKALGPRSIPTPAAVAEELRKLRVEEGREPYDASSDEEEAVQAGRNRTALAKEPTEYFAFCG